MKLALGKKKHYDASVLQVYQVKGCACMQEIYSIWIAANVLLLCFWIYTVRWEAEQEEALHINMRKWQPLYKKISTLAAALIV